MQTSCSGGRVVCVKTSGWVWGERIKSSTKEKELIWYLPFYYAKQCFYLYDNWMIRRDWQESWMFLSDKRYFRDLASPEASVREAAAISLVTRLQEIQKQYKMLPDKESVDGGLMLEAQKNDGLDNCAPHLRYALGRLIRGVSSSREVISFSGSVLVSRS